MAKTPRYAFLDYPNVREVGPQFFDFLKKSVEKHVIPAVKIEEARKQRGAIQTTQRIIS